MGYRVAVVGATGAVGRELMAVLEEVRFPIDDIHAVASRASKGVEVSYADRILRTEDFERFDFSGVDIVLMSAGADLSRAHAERIGRSAAVVIDNSSAWRMHPQVPLVVPEVNPDAVDGFRAKGIIANPNCSTIQLVAALKPLHDEARIKRVVVSTYQSVSGAGKDAMDELWETTKGMFVLGADEPKHFTKQIAFNLIPHIDDFLPDGQTKEEWKMMAETQKILDPSIQLTATCVRVPVFVGHSESVNIEFETAMDEDEAREILREAPGVQVIDKREDGGYITPVEAVGEFAVYVSRIRRDPTVEHGLNMWVVSDNLRKGAALNAVQIAQLLDDRGLIGGKQAA
jgi:aspartate-semialdehyde dehydrogenase